MNRFTDIQRMFTLAYILYLHTLYDIINDTHNKQQNI